MSDLALGGFSTEEEALFYDALVKQGLLILPSSSSSSTSSSTAEQKAALYREFMSKLAPPSRDKTTSSSSSEVVVDAFGPVLKCVTEVAREHKIRYKVPSKPEIPAPIGTMVYPDNPNFAGKNSVIVVGDPRGSQLTWPPLSLASLEQRDQWLRTHSIEKAL